MRAGADLIRVYIDPEILAIPFIAFCFVRVTVSAVSASDIAHDINSFHMYIALSDVLQESGLS